MTGKRRVNRAGPIVLAALAPLSLLAVDPAGWYPFGPVKWLVVSLVGFGGAALLLAQRPFSVPRRLVLALTLLVGWLTLAAVVGLDPLYAWTGTPERHFGIVTWVLCAVLLVAGCSLGSGDVDEPRGRPLPWGLALAGLGVGGAAMAEAVGWEPQVFDVGRRLTGTLGSAAYLGAASALLLPICVGIAADELASRRLRLIAAATLAPLGIACVGSGARAAWVGLAVSGAVLVWLRRSSLHAHRRAAGLVAAVGLVALVGMVALTPMGARLGSITDADAPGGRGRLDEWRVATRVVADHLVTGVGPEGYRVAFAEGVDARYERAHGRDPHPDRAHAGPLDVALAGGLPALAAWLAVVLLVGRAVIAVLRAGRGWVVGVAAGLVAHMAGQLLLFPIVELEPMVWLLAGVVVSVSQGWHQSIELRPRLIPAVVGAAAMVALVLGVTEVVADRRAGEAADALARGDHSAAADAAGRAVDLRPDTVRLHVLAARTAVADDQGTLAGIRELDAALDVSPGDPIVLRERLRLLVARAAATLVPAHLTAAQDELDRLLAADPSNAAYWQQAEALAELAGDDEAAADAHRRWKALTPAERMLP
jgi:hypothetical protein